MKFFNQQGDHLQRTNLTESENVCPCCQSFDHEATAYHPDDVMCPDCQSLCRCACHRNVSDAKAA